MKTTKIFIRSVIILFSLCLTATLPSCGRKEKVISTASEAIAYRNYDDALRAILSLSDKTIAGSDTLSQLLSTAYYGLSLRPLNAVAEDCYDMDFTPDYKSVVFTDFATGKLNIYHYPELTFDRTIKVPDRAFSIDISPDGNTLAAGLANNIIRIYNLNNDSTVNTLFGHSQSVRDVEFTNDSILFSCGNDRTVAASNINHRIYFWPRRLNDKNIKSISLNKDHTRLVAASNDGSACVLDITDYTDMKEELRLVHGPDYVNDSAISPDNEYIATVSGDGYLKLWDGRTGTLTKRVFLNEPLCSIDISDNGQLILIGGHNNAFIVDPQKGIVTAKIPGSNTRIWAVEFIGDDEFAFTDKSRFWHGPVLTRKKLIEDARQLSEKQSFGKERRNLIRTIISRITGG